MKSSGKAYDDLTVIRGIGPARQRWLRKSFSVRTFQDVAALSADEIESRLKAEGQITSRSEIEQWIAQGQELAGAADSPAAGGEWQPFASFVVEFQTREIEGQAGERRTTVHHMEEDTGTYWPGIESRKLCQWMLDQIRTKVGLEPGDYDLTQAQPAEAPPAEKPSAKIKISQIRVFQPPQSEAPTQTIEAGKPFRGSVKGDEPFTFEVDFELTGPAAPDIARQELECNARSYAYDRVKKTSIDLGDTGLHTFEEGEFAYTFTLPEAILQRGDYRLWVLVTPQGALAMPDYVEVPLLQVV
jgi:hypothetical protein